MLLELLLQPATVKLVMPRLTGLFAGDQDIRWTAE